MKLSQDDLGHETGRGFSLVAPSETSKIYSNGLVCLHSDFPIMVGLWTNHCNLAQ